MAYSTIRRGCSSNEPCTSQELIAYCLFGEIADKRKLLKDEADEPLSEIFERKADEAVIARAIACSIMLLVLPACGIPPLRIRSRDQKCRKTSMDRPARKTQLSSGSKSFTMIECLRCLIEKALVDNRELKILNEEVQIAGNEVLARSGAYLPFVTCRGRRGAEQIQPLHGRRSRHTRRPVSPREALYQSVWKFRGRRSTSPGSSTSTGSCGMPGTRRRSATSPPVRGGTTS